MARKRTLQDLLRRDGASAPPDGSGGPRRPHAGSPAPTAAADDAALATIQRGQPYRLSLADETDLPLPPAVRALRPELSDIARFYLRARQRSGHALLEAARWLSEARVAARHGEWDDFLAATHTSPDTAERLLRIYTLALQSPAFAQAIVTGRLNQSVAERLARPSTPADIVETLLATEQPISVAHVERAIRRARQEPTTTTPARPRAHDPGGEMPQIAAFGVHDPGGEIPQIAAFGAHDPGPRFWASRLQEIADVLRSLARHPEQVPNDAAVRDALDAMALAVQTIQEARGWR